MLNLITIGDSPTNGKPHIYVTGHADDVKAEISEITALLHSQWNCVVCYHDDPENEADDTGVLDKMNTVVLLISAKFVQEKTAAYETVFMHASKTGIPVIPIMLQKSAELDNAANKMLGDRHCLFIGQPDLGEKIKREFNRIFITDEFREEVRKCFDTTVFLSYRKYDRELAEELIRRIHGFEFCQGVSVWYDDFLVSGENFNTSILTAMNDASLVVFSVTPTLMQKGNYAMDEEFTHAYKTKKKILPVEMQKTDPNTRLYYTDPPFPEWISKDDDTALEAALREYLGEDVGSHNGDPKHDYLLGLAYRDGFGVEIDRAKALRLISASAEKGYPGAIAALRHMYEIGNCIERSYEKAVEYQRKMVEYYEQHPEASIGGLQTIMQLYYLGTDMERFGMQKCVSEYKKLIKMFGEMLQKTGHVIEPGSIEYNILPIVADTHRRLAEINHQWGDDDAAEYHMQQSKEATEIRAKLDQAMGKSSLTPTIDEITDLKIKGDRLRENGDDEAAHESYVRAYEICSRLLDDPDSLGSKYTEVRRLAYTTEERLAFYMRPEKRADVYKSCMKKASGLSKEYPDSDIYILDTAMYCKLLADTYEELGDVNTTVDFLTDGIKIMKELVKKKQMTNHYKSLLQLQANLCRIIFTNSNDNMLCLSYIKDAELTMERFDWVGSEWDYVQNGLEVLRFKALILADIDSFAPAFESIDLSIEITKKVYEFYNNPDFLTDLGISFFNRSKISYSYLICVNKNGRGDGKNAELLRIGCDIIRDAKVSAGIFAGLRKSMPGRSDVERNLSIIHEYISDKVEKLYELTANIYNVYVITYQTAMFDRDTMRETMAAAAELAKIMTEVSDEPSVYQLAEGTQNLYAMLSQ